MFADLLLHDYFFAWRVGSLFYSIFIILSLHLKAHLVSSVPDRFSQMKACPDTYYIIVIENQTTGQIIGSATLVKEQKFIHGASAVSGIKLIMMFIMIFILNIIISWKLSLCSSCFPGKMFNVNSRKYIKGRKKLETFWIMFFTESKSGGCGGQWPIQRQTAGKNVNIQLIIISLGWNHWYTSIFLNC